MQIAPVYRLRVTEIPNNPGVEIFPTVELIDRTYPPPGLKLKFPVPIELTLDELELAARGSFVTRIIYVEDPRQALPIAQAGEDETQRWVEARSGADPVVEADELGRPIAILRMGGRVPGAEQIAAEAAGLPFTLFEEQAACLKEIEKRSEVPSRGYPSANEQELIEANFPANPGTGTAGYAR
jgi:hypothetical protein